MVGAQEKKKTNICALRHQREICGGCLCRSVSQTSYSSVQTWQRGQQINTGLALTKCPAQNRSCLTSFVFYPFVVFPFLYVMHILFLVSRKGYLCPGFPDKKAETQRGKTKGPRSQDQVRTVSKPHAFQGQPW